MKSKKNQKKCVMIMLACLISNWSNTYADFTFGTAVNLGPVVNSGSSDWGTSISADGRSLYFGSRRAGRLGPEDIYVTTRDKITDPWGEPTNLGPPVNNSNWEQLPSISADGLTLYFSGDWSGTYAADSDDIFMTTRENEDSPWSIPVNLGAPVNTSSADWTPSISADGLELYFSSNRAGGYGRSDIWVTTRDTIYDAWKQPVNLGPTVNSGDRELSMCISYDGLLLIFGSDNRPGGFGGYDLWMSRRTTKSDPWSTPVNLGSSVNSSANYDQTPSISADGSMLYFCSNRPGGIGDVDLYQAPIYPIVDFNGDGKVDGKDVLIMTEHWGSNDSSCDIGPYAWGDGIVDIKDIVHLAEYIGKDVYDPTLIIHWPLDEIEGITIKDIVSGNDAYVLGDAICEPNSGKVGGALYLDGVDDYVVAGSVLDPADGPFSVLVWINGGAKGQAIISETGGQDWLSLDPLTGYLMTELANSGRSIVPLISQTTIDDGNWHRIGLVWDGSYRTLYIDEVVVAQDIQNNLDSVGNGLYIGCSDPMQPNTFFSGMIDDVRIYNRAVMKP